jgi:AcrR family transcriptional regulator
MDSALELVADGGPATVSLREVARRAGVSHAAPTHHFSDKTGLMTALAAEGWAQLADALATTAARTGDFAELGVSYVLFATDHPGYFSIMRRPELVRSDDPALTAARGRAGELLRHGAAHDDAPAEPARVLAGWALVHGLATLLQEGNVVPPPGDDIAALARSVTRQLQPP